MDSCSLSRCHSQKYHFKTSLGTSLVVQWLRVWACTAGGCGFYPWSGNYDTTCLKWRLLSRVRLQPHRLYIPWNSPGQNTGVGGLALLQGIFPTQGSNPGLLHCRWILYQLSHKGSPRGRKLSFITSLLCSTPSAWLPTQHKRQHPLDGLRGFHGLSPTPVQSPLL